MGATKRKKIHEKGRLRLWENYSAYDGETWYTIHEEDVCNSLEEICYAFNGDKIGLVNEVIKRGNKVDFTDNATYEDYIAQFEAYKNGNLRVRISHHSAYLGSIHRCSGSSSEEQRGRSLQHDLRRIRHLLRQG